MQYPQTLVDPQINDLSLQNHYDIVIIGSGVSCCYTMIHYLSLLTDLSPKQPVKIAVIEKSGQFWTGVPYGNQTERHSLIISSLNEFLPQPELDKFKDWLDKKRSSIFDGFAESKAGILAKKWIQSHVDEISAGLWDQLFIPRYTFGCYLQERIEQLLEDAKSQNIAECDRFEAEAVDVQQVRDLYQIEIVQQSQASSFLLAQKVVLAIGSPPNKESDNALGKAVKQSNIGANEIHYVDDMYHPSQGLMIERICEFLKQSNASQPNQVLIIGSNASALEAIYSLMNSPDASQLISKFIVVSPNGEFPHRIEPPSTYEPKHLKALQESENITAEEIFIAVKKDVDCALAQNETIGGTYAAISKGVIDGLNKLSPAEQKLFVSVYGVAIGKFQRRAGADYLNVIEQLIEEGKLEFIKGKFVKTISLPSGGIGFEFSDSNSSENQIFTTPVKIVINCAGFQDLLASSSTLINNLIRHEICVPNDSKNGFEINENFETRKNFYLMGPLVAGNMTPKFKVWHAESVPRIIHLSKMLAEALVKS